MADPGLADRQRRGPFLYASAAGFAPDMVALAAADPSIHLVTLDELYPDD